MLSGIPCVIFWTLRGRNFRSIAYRVACGKSCLVVISSVAFRYKAISGMLRGGGINNQDTRKKIQTIINNQMGNIQTEKNKDI